MPSSARTAQIADVAGSGQVLAYGAQHPDGAPLAGTKLDKRIGSCRRAHGATLATKSRFGHDTATYAGLVA